MFETDKSSLSPHYTAHLLSDSHSENTHSVSVTVYSTDVPRVRAAIQRLSELGQSGIALSSAGYGGGIEYLFNGLNTVKPQMVEEATRQAREVAEKFAADSQSLSLIHI